MTICARQTCRRGEGVLLHKRACDTSLLPQCNLEPGSLWADFLIQVEHPFPPPTPRSSLRVSSPKRSESAVTHQGRRRRVPNSVTKISPFPFSRSRGKLGKKGLRTLRPALPPRFDSQGSRPEGAVWAARARARSAQTPPSEFPGPTSRAREPAPPPAASDWPAELHPTVLLVDARSGVAHLLPFATSDWPARFPGFPGLGGAVRARRESGASVCRPAPFFLLLPVGRNGAVEQPANPPPRACVIWMWRLDPELGVRGVARGRISRWGNIGDWRQDLEDSYNREMLPPSGQ